MNDLKFAFRQLLKNLGFTAVAVLTLALGIGANTAIFSIADAVLFRPIDLRNLDRLMSLNGTTVQNPDLRLTLSPADYLRFRDEVSSFAELAAYHMESFNLTGDGGDPEFVNACRTTANFFEVLDVPALFGRSFLSEESEPGRERVVVLGNTLWRRSFAADRNVVGKAIELHGIKHDVIGVMPPEVNLPAGIDLWVPYTIRAELRNQHDGFFLRTVGRLKPGVSRTQAEAEAKAVAARLTTDWPDSHTGRTARVDPLREQMMGYHGPQMMALVMGAVGFVLLIACVNVAILQFARMTSRVKELAVRAALGASRSRVLRQVLVESVALGLGGALVGVWFAVFGLEFMKQGAPPEITRFFPNWHKMGINNAVLAYLMAIGAGAGILAGIVPAFMSSTIAPSDALKNYTRGATAGRSHHRLRSCLVIAQIVLALVLLVGAGLMVKGVRNIASPNASLPAGKILTFRVALPESRYPEEHRRAGFVRQLQDGISALPEVGRASFIRNIPYSGGSSYWAFQIEGQLKPRLGETPAAQYQVLYGDYLESMKIRLMQGRRLDQNDTPDSTRVCLISQALARQYFPGRDPLGKRIRFGGYEEDSPWWTIVGVTSDIRHGWEHRTSRPTFYLPYQQAPDARFDVLVETKGDPDALIPGVRSIVRRIDPQQPIYGAMTLKRLFEINVFGMEYLAGLMTLFGALALVLATVGIYSVIAFAVAERTHEIAVRIALGAAKSNVLWLSLKRALNLFVAGVPIGLLLAVGLARVIGSLIYGVSTTDMDAISIAVLALAGAGLVASYIPARRATKVDPMEALRYE